MQQPTSSTTTHKGGYKLYVEPGKPQKLWIGTYWPGQPAPQFEISCQPDDESLAYHSVPAEQEDDDLMDITGEIRVLIAGTNNSELEQALGRLEQGNSLTVDGAVAIVDARDEVWRAAERM